MAAEPKVTEPADAKQTVSKPTVNIRNSQNIIKLTADIRKLLKECISVTLRQENFNMPSEVNILLIDNKKIRKINREYREVDSATDVLSFPMLDLKSDREIEEYDMNPESGSVILGDIVISLERAEEQAKEYGHSFEREVAFLATHGMFHLLGYDHEDSTDDKSEDVKSEDVKFADTKSGDVKGANVMFEKQEKVLIELGLTRKEN